MLLSLDIKNYALIQHLRLTFSHQLNLITGETGTGKSIIIGAIGLLLGNRADSKVLQNEGDKCIVEGTFNISDYGLNHFFEQANLDYDSRTILRREITPGGKSRAFINDTPVTLETIRKVGLNLMNIHSQHEVIALKNQSFQLHIIDLYAANKTVKKEYQLAWERSEEAKKSYNKMSEEADVLQREFNFVTYQLEELTDAQLEKGEQDQLESDLKMIEHAEEIKNRLNIILHHISGDNTSVSALFSETKTQLSTLSRYSKKYILLQERFESLWIELQDIIADIAQEESGIECDTKNAEIVKDRIDLIYKLLHKHKKNTIAELLLLQKELQSKADRSNSMSHELNLAEKTLQKTSLALQKQIEKLSDSRKDILDAFCKEITTLLQQLGMPHAKLRAIHTTNTPGPTGGDRIEFLFSANKDIAERSLSKVASGGEFSRLVFCIRYTLARKTSLPTLILDEIDTGISGETAIRMGNMMKRMARQCQLIIISHLPQIAAKADRHFYVYKKSEEGKTTSNIKLLNEDEQITAIAKMIGGDQPPAAATESAIALMKK